MKVGIVGLGVVGKHLEQLFRSAGHEISTYDKYNAELNSMARQDSIQVCDLVFVSVPTPARADGSNDTTEVEEAVSWIKPPICIKSTIVPGTTNRLIARYQKRIVFSPEYIGETPFHKYVDGITTDLVVLGGLKDDAKLFADVFRSALGPEPIYFLTDAVTAELAKYMENCFFATKVAFVAQFHRLSELLGADFDQLREIWVADSRIGRSHSTVIGRPGFSGKCLPKDLAAIVSLAAEYGGAPFLEAVQLFNNAIRQGH